MENNNKIDFDENKPYVAPHNHFSLEGHWQPWYDDRRDYGRNDYPRSGGSWAS